jgi:pimeloyl-ACP methyl ester carboxylesterase
LVLLHPLGSSRRVWGPILGRLAERFDVLAVDLPGFGESAPLPQAQQPSPEVLAASVSGLLDDLGITAPHVLGNSLGGWLVLELAGHRPVASLMLLSPAGLWRRNAPLYCRVSLWLSRWMARYATRPLLQLVRYRLGRAVVLGQTHGRPTRMTRGQARQAVIDLATCPGFDATLRATARRHYTAGSIDAPVTVAFGSRDRLLLRHQSRHLEQLPSTTVVNALPHCGHLPVADDPDTVTALIISATNSGTVRDAREQGLRGAPQWAARRRAHPVGTAVRPAGGGGGADTSEAVRAVVSGSG